MNPKVVVKSLLIATFLFTPIIATAAISTNYDTAVELARVTQIDNLVKRITDLNARTKQYMLSTGDIAPTVTKINTYFGIASTTVWKNYEGGILAIDTSVSDSLIITNIFEVVPSVTIQGYYKNSPSMDKLAIINVSFSELKIPFDTVTYGFVQTTKAIIASGTATISRTEPTDTTKLWYKPVGDGSYEILKYDTTSGKWKSLGKTSASGTNGSGGTGSGTIIVGSIEELNALPAKAGDTAMVSDGTTAEGYVYDGTQWVKTSTGGTGGLFNGTGSVEAMATTLFSKSGGSIVETIAPFAEFAGSKTFTKKDDVATGGYWISSDNQFVVVDKISNLDALDALFLPNTIAWTAKQGGGVYALQKRTMPNTLTVWVYLATDYADVLSRLDAPYKNNQGQYIYSTTYSEYFHQLPSLNYIEPVSPAVTFITKGDRNTFPSLIATGRYLLQTNDCTSMTCNGLEGTAYYAGSTIDGLYAYYYSTSGNRKNNLVDAKPRASMTEIYNNQDTAALYGGYVYLKDVDNRGRLCYKRTTGEYVTKTNIVIPTGNNMPPSTSGTCSNAAYSGSAIILTNRTEMADWTDAPLTSQAQVVGNTNTYTFTNGASNDHFWKSPTEWVTNGSRSDFDMANSSTIKYLSKQVGSEPNYTGVDVGVTSMIDSSFKEWFYSTSGATTQRLLDGWPTSNAYTDTTAISIGYAIQSGIVLQKCGSHWCRIGTSQVVNSSLVNGTTASVVAIGASNTTTNCSSTWTQSTQTAGMNNLGTGDCAEAANGLHYDGCEGGNNRNYYSAMSYCSSKGMRVPSISEARAWSVSGVPSCNNWTMTVTFPDAAYDSDPDDNYVWMGTSTNIVDTANGWGNSVRCVR